MARVRSKDTEPELRFRKAIWRAGYRFRTCDARLPGKPDLTFARHRLAVFIDGDFWHGHQWRTRKLLQLDDQFTAAANGAYWRQKIRRNVERDFRNTAALLADGWSVLRFWESDIRHDLQRCVNMTLAALQKPKHERTESLLAGRTVAEFFAGVGLVRLALENRGWRVVYANDFDEQKAAIYRSNFADDHLSTADVHTVSADDVPDCALMTASFPCNDLSVAGAKAGLNGKQSSAYWGFLRVVEEMGRRRPPFILLENVVGFLTSHGGRDFEDALLALNKLGYVCDAMVLNASSFVPQSRARLFIVAKQQPMHEASGPLEAGGARPAALAEFINTHPKIGWDIRPLPAPPEPSGTLAEILEDLPPDDPAWWNEKRVAYFMNQLSERHAAIAERMIAGRRVSYATAFRRVRKGRSMAELRTDGIAGCLRTPRGGSARQILFKAGRGKRAVRLMTARECARLQGVPDSYQIDVPLTQALFAFGDAVCVPVVEWIAENYLNPAASELMRGRLLGEQVR